MLILFLTFYVFIATRVNSIPLQSIIEGLLKQFECAFITLQSVLNVNKRDQRGRSRGKYMKQKLIKL